MIKMRNHISLLSALMLMFGFLFSGTQVTQLYASTNNTFFSNFSKIVSLHQSKKVNKNDSKEDKNYFVDIEIEDTEEVNEEKVNNQQDRLIFLTTFYSTLLHLLEVKFSEKIDFFDESSIISVIPLYLQLEDFRL